MVARLLVCPAFGKENGDYGLIIEKIELWVGNRRCLRVYMSAGFMG